MLNECQMGIALLLLDGESRALSIHSRPIIFGYAGEVARGVVPAFGHLLMVNSSLISAIRGG